MFFRVNRKKKEHAEIQESEVLGLRTCITLRDNKKKLVTS